MALPAVFMSYPRASDRGGRIARLRRALEDELSLLTREREFRFLPDLASLGENEQRRVQEDLEQATILIPIVQPLLFTDEACRAELATFLAREESQGRNDLVFPIYYFDCEDFRPTSQDPLRRALASRKYEDCRHLRLASDNQLDKAVSALARRMLEAFRRAQQPKLQTPVAAGPRLASAPSASPTNSPDAPKLRVLLVGPHGDYDLAVQFEQRIVEDELRIPSAARRVRVESLTAAGADLPTLLHNFSPDILHFSGHGLKDEGLSLNDPRSESDKALLEDLPRGGNWPRVIVLNACYSPSVASELTRRQHCVVLGTHAGVREKVARRFAEYFYHAIAHGKDVRSAFDQASAALVLVGIDSVDLPRLAESPGVDPSRLILLPRDTPDASRGATPRSETTRGDTSARGFSPEQRNALVKLLLSLFSSGEFLHFLRLGSDTAWILRLLPGEGAPPIQLFTEAVEQFARSGLLDAHFFRRITQERPGWQHEIRQVQTMLLGAS